MLKKYLVIGFCSLIALQFYKSPKDNVSDNNVFHISTKYSLSDDINKILVDACNDCHSNKTIYPSYYNWQPVGIYLNSHIKNGKKKLNFSEFTNKKIAIQNHKFEEIIETVGKHKSMPLKSYTFFGLHPEAKLNDAQRNSLVTWAKNQMDTIRAHFAVDSLLIDNKK